MTEWKPIELLPEDGSTVIVKLSNGNEIEAEYWSGPESKPHWGGWAWNGTQSFFNGTTAEDSAAEWVAWKEAPPKVFYPPE